MVDLVIRGEEPPNAPIVVLIWMLAMSSANSIQVCHSQSQPNDKPGLVVEGVLPPIVIGGHTRDVTR